MPIAILRNTAAMFEERLVAKMHAEKSHPAPSVSIPVA